jgi:hypothetical protein
MTNAAIWEANKDFGNGERLYRCLDIATTLGQSCFQYFNARLGWREVRNYDVRAAMHRFTTENHRDPF